MARRCRLYLTANSDEFATVLSDRLQRMDGIHLWLPMGGREQQLLIPKQYIDQILSPSGVHEAGHVLAAKLLGGTVVGIAISVIPERAREGLFVNSIYGFQSAPVEVQCVVKAAGPAADCLFQGGLSEIAASGDLRDIEGLTGISSLEPYLTMATELLGPHESKVRLIASKMLANLSKVHDSSLRPLPNGWVGAMLLDETELLACF